jgi:hypothetical protein
MIQKMKRACQGFHANLEKGMHYGEQIVKGVTAAKGFYETGKFIYGAAQAAAPYIAGAAALA